MSDLLIAADEAHKIVDEVVDKRARAKEMSDKAYMNGRLKRLGEDIIKASKDGLSYIFVSNGSYNEAAKNIEDFDTEYIIFDSDISENQYITAKKIIQYLLEKGYNVSPSTEIQDFDGTKRKVKGMTVSW